LPTVGEYLVRRRARLLEANCKPDPSLTGQEEI